MPIRHFPALVLLLLGLMLSAAPDPPAEPATPSRSPATPPEALADLQKLEAWFDAQEPILQKQLRRED